MSRLYKASRVLLAEFQDFYRLCNSSFRSLGSHESKSLYPAECAKCNREVEILVVE